MLKRAHEQERGDWSLPTAVPIWLFASIAGWVAFAGFLFATTAFDRVAIAETLGGLTNLATALGFPRP